MTIYRPKSRPWIIISLLFGFLPEGMPIKILGRTPNVSLFDIGIVLVLLWLLAKSFTGRFDLYLKDRTLNVLMAAYIGANLLSFLFSLSDPPRSLFAIKVAVLGYCAYLIALSTTCSKQSLLTVIDGLIVFGCATSLLLIYSFATQWSGMTGSGWASYSKDEVEISSGASNYVASILVPIIPLALARLVSSKNKLALVWLFLVVTLAFGLAITTSKGALLSLGVGLVFMALALRKRVFRIKTLLVVAVVLLGIVVVVPWDLFMVYYQAFSVALAYGDPSRILIWKAAWNAFLQHPLLGVGPGCIYIYNNRVGEQVLYSHNYVLNSLADLGLTGAVPFLLMMGVCLKRALRLKSLFAVDSRESVMAIGLCAGLLATLAHGLVEPTFAAQEYSALFWVLLSLVFLYGRYDSLPERDQAVPSGRVVRLRQVGGTLT